MTYGSGRYLHKPHTEETKAKIRASYRRWMDTQKTGKNNVSDTKKKS